jgi:AsmA protein
VRSIHIIDGKLGWLPRPGAAPVWASIPRLDAAANGPDGALRLAGTLLGAGRTFELSGELGPLAGLTDGGAVGPWPLRLTLRDKAARLELTGSIAQPMRGRGLALQVDASVGDFAGFEPFLPPGVPVPHDATAVLRVADGKESGRASLTGITLHLGRLPPGQPLPGVDISRADFSAPALDGPLHAELEGRADVGALKLVADAGSLAALLPGAEPPAPVPIEATLDAGAAHFSAKGTVAHPAALAGVELDASASVPDLAAFAPLLGRPLPKLAQVAFDGHLSGDLSGGGAIGVRKATLSLPQARIAGDVEVRPGARPDVRAHLTSPRLDLDALLAVLLAPPAAPPPAPAPAAAAPSGPPRLFPDTPIDVSALDRIDLDVDFHVDALRAGGAGYTQVAGTAKLRDGKLVLDPLAGTTPGGAAEARLSIDARAAVPGFALVLRAPSLQLAPLVAAFGASAPIGGSISVEADLQGVGRSPHAIAASLDGHLGVQSVDAEIDNRELISLLRLSRLPEVPLGSGGTTKLRCFALRLDASNGIATVGALVADLHRLVVTGGGALDLGQEQFALQLRPLLRVGGALGGIVVPVRVGGGFFDPKVTVGAGGKGGLPIAGPGASDPCGPALAAAAGAGVPALKPAAEAAVPALLKGAPKTALDVLKGLIK